MGSGGDRVGRGEKRIGIGVGSRRKVGEGLEEIHRVGVRWVLIANTNFKNTILKKNDDYQLGIPFKKHHSSIIQVGLSCDKKNDSDNSQSVIAL